MIYLNGMPLDSKYLTRFPDNTTQLWKLPDWILNETNYAHITWDYTHEGDLLALGQLKDLLDLYDFKTTLRIRYLPFARQDKPVSNTATFALRSFAKLLNVIAFDEVLILDPHSKVALDLINNSKAYYPVEEVMKIAFDLKADLFCYPDAGAVNKYTGGGDIQQEIYDYPCIYGEKVRDQLTGNILSYNLVGECAGKNVLIVDDICDGGMTFKLLAKDLLAAGAKEVNLFVTHGIFSKGLRTLTDSKIKRVFTKDGEVGEHQNNITYRRL